MCTRKFLAAVFISLLLHAVLISGAWLRIPDKIADPRPLDVRVVSAPLPAPSAASKPPKPPNRPAALRRIPTPAPPMPAVAAATPFALPPELQPPATIAQAGEPEPPTTEPIAELATEPAPSAATSAPAPVRSLPRRGRISYALYLGTDRFSVGKATQSWEVEADTYLLASEAETTGVVDFFRPQRLRSVSRGKLTPQGLQPEKFLTSRTRHGQTEASQAHFDWDAGNLTFGNIRAPRSVALPAGSQDLISFIYQMSLVPPQPGRFRVPVTNGSRFETYDVEVSDQEDIDTPLGMLKAIPVKQVRRAGAESIEIWLAAEFRYLPVKIRFLDREGNPAGEQIVNEIHISEE